MKKYAKTPTIFQMEATECGAASLSMIFSYWGKHLPLEQMRIETGVSRDGCNAGNIMRAAKRFGMECHGYRKEMESLKTLEFPCMIHWNFNHFVVLEGFKGKFAYINDPAVGRRKLTMEELDEAFTGIVLTFKPTENFTKQKKKKSFLSLIKNRVFGVQKALFQIILVGLALVLPGIIIPLMSQLFLDNILGKGDVSWFTQFIAFFAATVVFQALLTLYRSSILRKVQNRLVLLSSKDFTSKLLKLPVGFYDQRYAGDLASRVSNNENINSFIAGELSESILNIFVALFYLVVLFIYSPKLMLIGIIGVAANLIAAGITSNIVSKSAVKLQQDKGKLYGAICAGFGLTSTLKASGAENSYCSRILGYDAKVCSCEQSVSKIQTVASSVPAVIGNAVDVALLIVGSLFVIDGELTIGMLSAFITLFGSFSEPVEKLVDFVKQLQLIKVDMERVNDIMNYPADEKFVNKDFEKIEQAKLSGKVECKNISFGYSKLAKPLVEELSFNLTPGSSVAFVGSSGCGKSTVTKIISGLYKQWGGEVYFDGVSSEKIAPEVFHASVSVVSQNITLFSGTIKDNLSLWNPAVSEQDMINAAKDACIHEVITQKSGAYDFMLSEGGSNLSGGQRQRLEIARALVTNPTILIMDEATSALDPIVEKQIVDNIKRRGCTCIIVAHRLSAVRDCDMILVMENGKVVESGSHEELVDKKGYYCGFMNEN